MDSQLEEVRHRARKVEDNITDVQQDLATARQAKDVVQERVFAELLLNYNKQLLSLQEKETILLHRQTSRSSLGGTAVRKWGNNHVNVKIKGATFEASPVQLYLAAGESDQATSGHILLDNLRTLMHGLPTDIPIMACEDIDAVFTKAAPLQRDVNDLSQKAFTAGSELIVWPGTLDAAVLRVLQSGYNTLSSNCQHVLASLTVGISNSKED